ncbi:MAG: thioredoxin family protein [Planctomycetota bacterium]|nr:thioredoxin family protein [Planctomycetota bacterium]
MVKTASTMLPLGTHAPDFSLPNVDGKTLSLADLDGKRALVVIFMCNHCPFVIHIRDELVKFAKEYQAKGAAIVAISSNDVVEYPQDSIEKMAEDAREFGYTFPYLLDESQATAQAYKAACTPDFYVFDADQTLVYRGQFDDSRPQSGIPVTGKDLRIAVDRALAGDEPLFEQSPSLGCNIKWKAGNEPVYFTGQPAATS